VSVHQSNQAANAWAFLASKVPSPTSMRRIFLILIVVALPAGAQWRRFGSETHPAGFFGVGFAAPTNPLATRLDAGWSLAGGVGVTNNYFGVMLDGMFTEFGINRTTLDQRGAPRGNQRYWSVTVDPIFHVNERGPVDFYITGGGGLFSRITEYRLSEGFAGPFYGRDSLLASYTIYKPGVDAGVGFTFSLGYRSPVKIYTEARFNRMFTSGRDATFIPVTIGVRF
jgi:hypothetical protein